MKLAQRECVRAAPQRICVRPLRIVAKHVFPIVARLVVFKTVPGFLAPIYREAVRSSVLRRRDRVRRLPARRLFSALMKVWPR